MAKSKAILMRSREVMGNMLLDNEEKRILVIKWVWWHRLIIAGVGRLRQKEQHEFEDTWTIK